jgi:hypothetical protein
VEGVSKAQQRVFTVVGVIVGLVAGFIALRRAIADKEGVLEAGDFVLGVFIGGAVGIVLYTLIKDGIPWLLKRRGGAGRGERTKPKRDAAAPARTVATTAPTAATAPKRKEPLRAAGRERPLRTERPLKPRD